MYIIFILFILFNNFIGPNYVHNYIMFNESGDLQLLPQPFYYCYQSVETTCDKIDIGCSAGGDAPGHGRQVFLLQ